MKTSNYKGYLLFLGLLYISLQHAQEFREKRGEKRKANSIALTELNSLSHNSRDFFQFIQCYKDNGKAIDTQQDREIGPKYIFDLLEDYGKKAVITDLAIHFPGFEFFFEELKIMIINLHYLLKQFDNNPELLCPYLLVYDKDFVQKFLNEGVIKDRIESYLLHKSASKQNVLINFLTIANMLNLAPFKHMFLTMIPSVYL